MPLFRRQPPPPLQPLSAPRPLLTACDRWWGAASVRPERCSIELHEHAYVLPLPPGEDYSRYDAWGAFGRDGCIIDAGALRRGQFRELVGQAYEASTGLLNNSDKVSYPVIYGGYLNPHFGHFIVSTLSRLWLLQDPQWLNIPVAFVGPNSTGFLDHFAFIGDIFARLGLSQDKIKLVDRPLRFDHLIVPRTAFEEQSFAHSQMRTFCQWIGEPHWSRQRNGPIYLSKTRMNSGVQRVLTEHLIEQKIKAAGIDVVYPETLAFGEQVAAISSAAAIIGTAGSALHNQLFAQNPSRVLGLSPQRAVNSNLRLIDLLCDSEASYLYPVSTVESKADDGGFLTSFIIHEAEAVGDELVNRIRKL